MWVLLKNRQYMVVDNNIIYNEHPKSTVVEKWKQRKQNQQFHHVPQSIQHNANVGFNQRRSGNIRMSYQTDQQIL